MAIKIGMVIAYLWRMIVFRILVLMWLVGASTFSVRADDVAPEFPPGFIPLHRTAEGKITRALPEFIPLAPRSAAATAASMSPPPVSIVPTPRDAAQIAVIKRTELATRLITDEDAAHQIVSLFAPVD